MIKPIAIYLPQFHPIPENDQAWGEGFTEWTNVKKAQPLFEGHYQPHVPHDSVGYYDLRDPEVMVRQAIMAKEYGIYGFAFYHYWFNGKRLLETPLDNMLKTGKPDFPFCYIWANEHWSRRWDGSEHEIIQEQHYSEEDDIAHIRFLCKNVFSDKRYITIDGKPLFIVYRTELLPDIRKTAYVWREEAKKFGFEDLYLVRVEGFVGNIDPSTIGFDSAMEFAPNWGMLNKSLKNFQLNLFDYPTTVFSSLVKNYEYPVIRTVFPCWDNTARKSERAFVFTNSSIDTFTYAMRYVIDYTKANNSHGFFCVNAWNEWGEGCHLEPDTENGFTILEALKQEVINHQENPACIELLNLQAKYKNIFNSNSYKIGSRIVNFLNFIIGRKL